MQLCFASSRYLTMYMYVCNIILSEYLFQGDFHQIGSLFTKKKSLPLFSMVLFLLVQHTWAIPTFCTLFPKSWNSCTLYLCLCSNCGGYPALLVSHGAAPKHPWTVMSVFVFHVKTLKTLLFFVKTTYRPTACKFMLKLVRSYMSFVS